MSDFFSIWGWAPISCLWDPLGDGHGSIMVMMMVMMMMIIIIIFFFFIITLHTVTIMMFPLRFQIGFLNGTTNRYKEVTDHRPGKQEEQLGVFKFFGSMWTTPKRSNLCGCLILTWLVVSTPLKNMSQLGLLFPIYGEKTFMFQTTNQLLMRWVVQRFQTFSQSTQPWIWPRYTYIPNIPQ